ncbi:hypothetical protein GX563_08805 [Candidatus Bathyarchaeota archaeon]|nr:hypothetical protein [Candidatus Bathyarchaeota archaeon]
MNHYANPDYANPTIIVDNNSATIIMIVSLAKDVYFPAGFGTIMNAGGYLTEVTYNASWLGNRNITAYSGTSQSYLKLPLTDIPYGKQTIQVYATCNVLLYNNFPTDTSAYPVPQYANSIITFNVASSIQTPIPPGPTPTQVPSIQPIPAGSVYALSAAAIVVIALIAFVVAKKTSHKP